MVTFELPVVLSRPTTKDGKPRNCLDRIHKKGYDEFSMKIFFDNTPENVKAVATIKKVYELSVGLVKELKKELRFTAFNTQPLATGYPSYPSPLYYPVNSEGDTDLNANPSMYIKLFNFDGTKGDKGPSKTRFVGLDGNEIGWELLESQVEITHQPVITWQRNFYNGEMRMHWQMRSSVVLDIKERVPYVPQEKTLQTYKANEELQQKFVEQMAKFKLTYEQNREKNKHVQEEVNVETPANSSPPSPGKQTEQSLEEMMQSVSDKISSTQSFSEPSTPGLPFKIKLG